MVFLARAPYCLIYCAGKLAYPALTLSFRATCNLCRLKLQPLGKHSKLSAHLYLSTFSPSPKSYAFSRERGKTVRKYVGPKYPTVYPNDILLFPQTTIIRCALSGSYATTVSIDVVDPILVTTFPMKLSGT